MFPKRFTPLRILTGLARRANAYSAKRAKAKRLATAQAWLRSSATVPLKVNVGCGNEPFNRWANLDLEPQTRADFLWDITDGLPIANDSCAFTYCEHFLEHIPVQHGVRFLVECHRSLNEGGVVRTGMPSAQEVIRHYYENIWASQPWLQKYGYSFVKTRAEYINVCFRDWGRGSMTLKS